MTIEEKCVLDKILEGKVSVLPVSIAIGVVYKIVEFGNLEEDGFEHGYLYLPQGSGIREHSHVSDIERYKVVFGDLNVKGEKVTSNICDLGCSHDIGVVNRDTVIETCKISSKFLSSGYQKNIEAIFDVFSEKNYIAEYNKKNKTYVK